MAKVQASISMSIDGFISGPNLDKFPGLGEGGEILHAWLGEPGGQRVVKEVFGAAGAVVTSRAIFDGTGGWGDDPPFRMPVFVVTHRPHEKVTKGATTFIFAANGIEDAIAQASAAAGEKVVHIMGGASIIQQALRAGLVDELQLHVAPVLLGAGTPLFEQISGPIKLERIGAITSKYATHLTFKITKPTVRSSLTPGPKRASEPRGRRSRSRRG
jgi:dihydrofolate reductase